jgi:probable rRNA maturation factor
LPALVICDKTVAGLSAATLERFLLRARRAAGLRGTVNVFLTGSAAMRSLNARFRGKDKATDVLSFPAGPARKGDQQAAPAAGEIAISADMAAENSLRFGHSPAQEVKILALHGILHLAGYDHERDNGQMARKEENLRHRLGLPAALIGRTVAGDRQSAVARPRPVARPPKKRKA